MSYDPFEYGDKIKSTEKRERTGSPTKGEGMKKYKLQCRIQTEFDVGRVRI